MAFFSKAKKVRKESLSVKTVGKTDGPTNHYKCTALSMKNARRAMKLSR